tara:strand:- start:444 stop:662 length:219 start_codon:yes stop_codon:yes gene_type:complete
MNRFLILALTAGLFSTVDVKAHPISLEERAVDLVVTKYDKQLKELNEKMENIDESIFETKGNISDTLAAKVV